jgi:hypothetical protein
MRDTARKALEKALESDNVLVRRGAARAFASYYVLPQVKAVPKLIKRLRDTDTVVRQWAATALIACVVDSDAAMAALLAELKNDNDFAFEIVVLLSRAASSQKVLPKVLKALDKAPSPIVRSHLIRAIGMAGPAATEAVPALQKALNDARLAAYAAEALFRIAPNADGVKRRIDAYFARHKFKGPYPGHAEDRRLIGRRIEYEGPEYNHAAPEAIRAGGRLFSNVKFVGKTKQEVFDVLGEGRHATRRDKNAEGALVYRFDTGFGGTEYRLLFKDGRVHSVKVNGLE